MKNRLAERLIFLFIFASIFTVMMMANQKNRISFLFNNDNAKIYRYYHLKPGEKLTGNINDADSLLIYSRVILNSSLPESYSYNFSSESLSRSVSRTITPSKSMRSVSGDKVSAWNSFKFFPDPEDSRYTITNDFSSDILVKVVKPNRQSTLKKYEYIAYPPDSHAGSVPVLINDNLYTYYLADSNGVNFRLEGPLLLKVVSRLIVSDVQSLSFAWAAYLDDQEILTVEDAAPYSSSCLADSSSVVTRGVTNIIQVPAGIHHLKIKDLNPDEIIYRFYLNKTALGK